MSKLKSKRVIYVFAQWAGMKNAVLMGLLHSELLRGKEVKNGVKTWRTLAAKHGIPKSEQELKALAFSRVE